MKYQYSSIALVIFIAFMVGIDFIEINKESVLYNVKNRQEGRYLLVFAASAFVLYTEHFKKGTSINPPSYEESISSF